MVPPQFCNFGGPEADQRKQDPALCEGSYVKRPNGELARCIHSGNACLMSTQSYACGVQAVAEDLNEQFRRGQSSGSLSEAGVVVRVFDECTDFDEPWVLSEEPPCWDRLVVSVINRRHPEVYRGNLPGKPLAPGFVFASPPALQRHLVCSYPRDAGTSQLKRACDPLLRGGWVNGDKSCTPGCFKPNCDPQAPQFWCSWRPDDLGGMLRYQDANPAGYNELILDTFHKPFDRLLPSIVVAVFVQRGCTEDEKGRARLSRDTFCAAHGLEPSCVPLLEYDAASTAPFSMTSSEEFEL